MEHRWGERVAVYLPVELSCGSGASIRGSLENVSSSGAFVRTEGDRPPRGPVAVIFQSRGSGGERRVRLRAYVVRDTQAGVGIEWCEFAPRALRHLAVEGAPARGARTSDRAASPTRHSARGPNTAMQPCARSGAEPAAIGTNTLPVAGSAATEWACGPVGKLPIQRLSLESTIPSTGPPVLAPVAR